MGHISDGLMVTLGTTTRSGDVTYSNEEFWHFGVGLLADAEAQCSPRPEIGVIVGWRRWPLERV